MSTDHPSGRLRSGRHDIDQALECFEIVGIAGVERELCGEGGRRDEQVDGAGSARFASCAGDSGEDAAVGAGCVGVEGERVEGGFGPLEPVLAAAAFGGVVGGVWAGGEFGEGDRTDGDLDRKEVCRDGLEVDDDRGVQQAARGALVVRHEV